MLTISVLALSLALVASAHPLGVSRRHQELAAKFTEPEGWFHDYLESYDAYHIRYLAVNCQDKHDTPFFDLCCHPMLATETLEKNRAPECSPGPEASASASAAAPTSTIDDSDGLEDCEEDEGEADTPNSVPEGSEEEDCEEDEEEEGEVASPVSTGNENVQETTSAVKEETTTKKSQPTTTTVAEQPENTEHNNDNDSGSGGQQFTGGEVTYYYQHNTAGACGAVHSDDDLIAAMNAEQYSSLDICGKRVKITSAAGKTVTVKVVDMCPGCKKNSIDLSAAAFKKLAPFSEGVVPLSGWSII